MTKFYVDGSGNYIGGFEGLPKKGGGEKDHPDVPAGATKIKTPPDDARQVWDGSRWSAIPTPKPKPLSGEEVFGILETKRILTAADRPKR